MSLYIIVGILLLLGTIIEVVNHKADNQLYKIFFVGLLLMLVFRYGQGTDYFGYEYNFEMLPLTFNFKTLSNSSVHAEIGWKYLCVLSRKLGISFQFYVGIIGIVTMAFLDNFIQKHCPLKVTALFIAYPTLYLTYISSGMRQGLAICVFLGLMLDLYIQKKKFKFVIAVCICATIHTASWVLLILLFDWIREIVSRNEYIVLLFSVAFGVAFYVFGFNFNFLGRDFSNESSDVSYIAVFERIISYIVIRICYKKYKQVDRGNKNLDLFVYIYSIGILFYGAFFSMPLLSSRMGYFFKGMELVICTILISGDKYKYPEYSTMFFYITALSMVMLVKNIDSYLSQGNYYDYITVWNYPYNNIFIMENYRYSIHQQLIS